MAAWLMAPSVIGLDQEEVDQEEQEEVDSSWSRVRVNAGVQPRWIQGNSKVGTESAS